MSNSTDTGTAKQLAASLRARMEELGLTVAELAERSRCKVLDVNRLLAGDPGASVGTLAAVATALEHVVVSVPGPAVRGIGGGLNVSEPKVETKVDRALKVLGPQGDARASRKRVALFIDFDGVAHKAGDSRIDDRGQIVGDKLFRWWPQLRKVLDEHPDVDVVVHSSWRKYWPTLESLRELLPADFAARISAITDPNVLDRQESIEHYLRAHPEIGAYVIVDDAVSDFDVDHPHLVVCKPSKGLGEAKAVEQLQAKLLEAAARLLE